MESFFSASFFFLYFFFFKACKTRFHTDKEKVERSNWSREEKAVRNDTPTLFLLHLRKDDVKLHFSRSAFRFNRV